jgi:hypothetical protein
MSQKSFRKARFAWMAGRQTQPDHLPTFAKRVMSLSLMSIVLLSFLFFTRHNTNAHTINANAEMDAALLMSTGENNQIFNTGVIGNHVWFDTNGNGLQDVGEPGVAGVTVTLYNAADDTVVSSTTTDGDGLYSFTDLLEGDYYVGFTLPAEHIFTTYNVDGAGIDGPNNSDVITPTLPIGITEVFSLGADETNENIDAGLLPGCTYMDWNALGYVTGDSSLQTFTNIQGRDLTMTIEVRVYNAAFSDIGLYQAASANYPATVNGDGPAFSVRNIDPGQPAGMIVTKIIFSEPISINNLWLEPFYFRADVNVWKQMAIQAFDSSGNGIIPGSFIDYNGSTLVAEPHPVNTELWMRSQFPITQTAWSGAFDINYGTQQIQEIDWYSWGENGTDLSLTHEIGSSYFGAFYFCQFTPTAVSLINVQSGTMPVMPWAAGLVVMVFMTGLLLTGRQRRKAGS